MESPCFSRPQSTASHLFARTRSFHRPTYKRPVLAFRERTLVSRSPANPPVLWATCRAVTVSRRIRKRFAVSKEQNMVVYGI